MYKWSFALVVALISLRQSIAAESTVRVVGAAETPSMTVSHEPSIRIEVSRNSAVIHAAARPDETSNRPDGFAPAMEEALALRESIEVTEASVADSRPSKIQARALTHSPAPIEPITPIGSTAVPSPPVRAMAVYDKSLLVPLAPATPIEPSTPIEIEAIHSPPVPAVTVDDAPVPVAPAWEAPFEPITPIHSEAIQNTPLPAVAFRTKPVAESLTSGPMSTKSEPTPARAASIDIPADATCAPYGCPHLPGQSGAHSICGVDCGLPGAPCCSTWHDAQCIPWSLFGPGEYVGPARTEHVSTYYLRVNDLITLTYITSRRKSAEQYRIGVGDRLRIESSVDESLDREVEVQPDGNVTMPLVGEVSAAGKTVQELREELDEVYRGTERQPAITVTPLDFNKEIQDIVRAVTSVTGSNGQTQELRVTPEGTIQVPALGSVYVQGLTLDELRAEVEARYAAVYGPGLLVTPALTQRATSYVFVGGEVTTPGRYTLEGPTTVMQSIALAGGWNNGGNIHQVVVFRRDENWCLKATKIDIHRPLYGKDPCPVNDVWLRDNDLVIVPKSKILCAADLIELYFTRGVYAVFPISFVYDFSTGSSVTPVPAGP
jgi:polysaccharide export outer membrane protein